MQIYSTVLQYVSLVSLELLFLFVRYREPTEAGPVTVLPVPCKCPARSEEQALQMVSSWLGLQQAQSEQLM